jgi:hypothetical protein
MEGIEDLTKKEIQVEEDPCEQLSSAAYINLDEIKVGVDSIGEPLATASEEQGGLGARYFFYNFLWPQA